MDSHPPSRSQPASAGGRQTLQTLKHAEMIERVLFWVCLGAYIAIAGFALMQLMQLWR
jgi:hypothetical protein